MLELQESSSTGSTFPSGRSNRPHSQVEPSPSPFGSATHSWGTAEAGIVTVRGHGLPSTWCVIGNRARKPGAGPGKPYEGYGQYFRVIERNAPSSNRTEQSFPVGQARNQKVLALHEAELFHSPVFHQGFQDGFQFEHLLPAMKGH